MSSDGNSDSFNRRLDQLRHNDRDARGHLLAEQQQWLREAAQREISPRAGDGDPSDIVQDCLVIADAKLDTFRGQGRPGFRAWLRGILHNLVRRAFRSRAQRRRRIQSLAETLADQPQGSESDSAGSHSSRQEQLRLVRRALDCLSPEDRKLIEARYEISPPRSFDELAKEFRTTAEALRQRTGRLRAILQEGVELLASIDACDLPAHYREALVFRHFNKLTYDEIGERLGANAHAARMICRQAEAWLESSLPPASPPGHPRPH